MTMQQTATSRTLGQQCAPSMANKQNKAEQMREEVSRMQVIGKSLIERQRISRVRVHLRSSGCYSLYDAAGHFIGHTSPPGAYTGLGATDLKAAASRMALSEEMLTVCRQLDLDVEATGAVSSATVDLARSLLQTMKDLNTERVQTSAQPIQRSYSMSTAKADAPAARQAESVE